MKVLLLRCLAVGSAGFIGAVARFLIQLAFGQLTFPLATLLINVTGSFILGWFSTYALSHTVSDATRLAVGVGFVGAYTTFSTYMWDTSKLAENGAFLAAVVNLAGSLILGLIAVRLGISLARWSN